MNLYLFGWIVLAAIVAAIPVPLIKLYTKSKNNIYILLSLLSYIILILAYSNLLYHENISLIYPLVKAVSILIVVTAGIIAFKEKLDLQYVLGILSGILSIYLLSK